MAEYPPVSETIRKKRLTATMNHRLPPLRLLSLDGGGVRGFSTIMLVQELMLKLFHELYGRAPRIEEIPKPCDHFDLIGGTGTGGLIAILLGRLRLDLETCKKVYIHVTKKVFETDKTIAGLPYRKTLFKASKLEEAIKEVMREYAGRENEEKEGFQKEQPHINPVTRSNTSDSYNSSQGSRSSWRSGSAAWGNGNMNEPLFDPRPKICRVFLTAVYKGSDDTTSPALLRTYNSTHATAPSSDITIWEAGRATCATYPAFKSIQIGQSIFLDEGSGRYSPVAQVLEEALVHEWPGREVGILVSIGSGKAPETEYKKETSSMIAASPLGKFIEAKEKHMAKVLDCEEIHRELLDGLHRTGVKTENYVRLNVESGITDFGMNEWSRIADISTRTRAYLGRPDIQVTNQSAAAKLAEIARISSGKNAIDLLNRELPDLPPRTSDIRDEFDDDEVRKHFEQLDRIAARIRV
ncbi:uncharacterized protein LAJ45_10613 [Morchella importuna]|uniref:FabD/lysophospholipase-like protein n=1 Tax=Morchella conica CCBAS932 TaxID=1392247 RepID=A0A3N4L378_9PEZI|nr:uncharacterized protein LAJ45_10613 [Morchella importuna]KAH8145333.1 hypothetical protein LAJ45_10613 [Morchella importuna]RPB17354.1 FabD/lysophospholipase-like protein [Morchella conica CCBAS932]